MSTHIDDHVGVVRKDHECRVCGETIRKGETCHIYRGVDRDIGRYTIYFHEPECWEGSRDWKEWEWESAEPGCVSRDEMRLVASEAAKASTKVVD